MALSTPSVDLSRLIAQQSKFISELSSPSFLAGAADRFRQTGPKATQYNIQPNLNRNFTPALSSLLQTGNRADVTGAGTAARSEGDRFFRDKSADINQLLSSMGLSGSSAQSAQLGQLGADVGTRIGEEILRANISADENASNRQLGALNPALGEGDLNVRAALGEGDLNLRAQQQNQGGISSLLSALGMGAGAGNDLISTLMTTLPGFAGAEQNQRFNALDFGRSSGSPGNQVKGPRSGPQVVGGAPKTIQEKIFDQLQASLRSLKTPALPGGLMTSVPEYLRSQAQGANNTRLQDILSAAFAGSPFSGQQADAQSMAAFRDPSAGPIGAQVVAGQNQSAQNQFMNDLARRFGPAFAGLGR